MKKTILAVYCVFILLIIVLADKGTLPLGILACFPHYDWIAHLILYGLLYALLDNVTAKKVFSVRLVLSIIILEELSQLFVSSRTFSLIDLFMGISGVLIVVFIKKRADFKFRNP